jgi:hypothetical protein
VGTSVGSSLEHGHRAQETVGILEYSRRAPSDVSGGSANSFDQHHTSALLHDIYRQLETQKLEIAELQQKLKQVEPRLEQSEMETEIWRRRSGALRKQLSRRNHKDRSGPGVPMEHYRLSLPGCKGKIVISTEMIANEKLAHRMAMVRAAGKLEVTVLNFGCQ